MTHFCKLKRQKQESLLLSASLKSLASSRLLLLLYHIYLSTMEVSFNQQLIITDHKALVFNLE